MLISEILAQKGNYVVTKWPEHTLEDVIAEYAARNISSVVITAHDGQPIGVVSDRDALRALAQHGEKAFRRRVTDVMQQPPPVCRPVDTVTTVMHTMTVKRIRHMVVVDGTRLAGIVSIGDLVKAKLRDADLESRVLRERALSRLAAE